MIVVRKNISKLFAKVHFSVILLGVLRRFLNDIILIAYTWKNRGLVYIISTKLNKHGDNYVAMIGSLSCCSVKILSKKERKAKTGEDAMYEIDKWWDKSHRYEHFAL